MDKYIIVTYSSLAGLEDEVNKKIEKGYIPIGMIGLNRYGAGQIDKMFYQPMLFTDIKEWEKIRNRI